MLARATVPAGALVLAVGRRRRLAVHPYQPSRCWRTKLYLRPPFLAMQLCKNHRAPGSRQNIGQGQLGKTPPQVLPAIDTQGVVLAPAKAAVCAGHPRRTRGRSEPSVRVWPPNSRVSSCTTLWGAAGDSSGAACGVPPQFGRERSIMLCPAAGPCAPSFGVSGAPLRPCNDRGYN